MINLSEPTATKRRIPFCLYDTAGATLQTGIVLSGSELQLSKNGAAFANFAGTVTEVGSGLYYYEATAAEVNTLGFLALKIVKTGIRTILLTDVIGGTGFYSTNFRIPIYLMDGSGNPLTGQTLTGSQLQISENGAAYANFAGVITEVGSGLYYYTPAAAEYDAAARFITVKVVKTGVATYILSYDMEEGGMRDVGTPSVTIASLPSVDTDYAEVQVYDNQGLNYIQITVQDRTDGPKLIVYETSNGFFHPFNGASTVSGSGTSGDPYVFRVYRRGRWPSGITITFRVKVIDSSGNLTEVE